MGTKFMGFARMLSTAKNSTRKEGFGRMFSSEVQKPPKVDMDTLTRSQRNKIIEEEVDARFRDDAVKGLCSGSMFGLVLGIVYGYVGFGWYPFKGNNAWNVKISFR
ncbi:hypothetical protein MKW92_034121 [Papaver armeniacum]|nr:hypothetical protein MKW92_034121 [Papaver armeniacum]